MKISIETTASIIEGFVHHFAGQRLIIAPGLSAAEFDEVMKYLEAVRIATIPPTMRRLTEMPNAGN